VPATESGRNPAAWFASPAARPSPSGGLDGAGPYGLDGAGDAAGLRGGDAERIGEPGGLNGLAGGENGGLPRGGLEKGGLENGGLERGEVGNGGLGRGGTEDSLDLGASDVGGGGPAACSPAIGLRSGPVFTAGRSGSSFFSSISRPSA
jgi:hypothetical protein